VAAVFRCGRAGSSPAVAGKPSPAVLNIRRHFVRLPLQSLLHPQASDSFIYSAFLSPAFPAMPFSSKFSG
jgi:hypothetical protein